MHRLRNMACVRGIGPYQLGLRRDRGVRLVAPTAQRLRRDPQILGDLFDRLGLRRIRAARLGQQPDGLRLELRRVSRSFCHGSIISHRVRGNAEQKSVHISVQGEQPGGDWRPIGEWNANFCAIKWQHGHCGKHQHV